MTDNPHLNAYIQAYENLTTDNLLQLGELFSEQVVFKDPFNHVQGKDATLAIFKHMFATTQTPKFNVINAAMHKDIGLLYWHFDFVLPSKQNQQNIQSVQNIRGMSRVRFDQNGLVTEHIDHWDAGEQIYSKVPILAWLIKQVKKRLSAQ